MMKMCTASVEEVVELLKKNSRGESGHNIFVVFDINRAALYTWYSI